MHSIQAADSAECVACPLGPVRLPPRRHASCARTHVHDGQCVRVLPKCIQEHSAADSSECVACPLGFQSATPASTACEPCPSGTYTVGNASVSCLKCLPGRFKAAGSAECQACPFGFVSEGEGATVCRRCPIGSYTVKTAGASTGGASACMPCDLGTFGPRFGVCENCSAGTFQDEKRMTACKLCPPSRYSTLKGATSQSECTFCPVDRTTGSVMGANTISACKCKARDFYYDGDDDGQQQDQFVVSELPASTPCPPGAVCPIDGSRLIHLHAEYHYGSLRTQQACSSTAQRHSRTASSGNWHGTRCCPAEARCDRPRSHDWTTDDQCGIGYSGPCAWRAKTMRCIGGMHRMRRGLPLAGVLVFQWWRSCFLLSCSSRLSDNYIEDRVEETLFHGCRV